VDHPNREPQGAILDLLEELDGGVGDDRGTDGSLSNGQLERSCE
jgi:hypothetical protein